MAVGRTPLAVRRDDLAANGQRRTANGTHFVVFAVTMFEYADVPALLPAETRYR